MIKSILFSAISAALITLCAGFFINHWFLNDYNWLWIAVPSFWVAYQVFSRLFKILDIVIGIAIITVIIILRVKGINFPSL